MYLLSLYHISVFYAIYPSGATTIVQLPLAFVRSGYMNPADEQVSNPGYLGTWWARTTVSGNTSRNFYFTSSIVYPSNTGVLYNGRPLC